MTGAGEFDDPRYRDNPVNRCYFCKTNLYDRIRTLTAGAIASGANLDDLGDYRPGLMAAAERAVVHPFIEAGMDKAAVRALARRLGLAEVAELPAQPCLSSRVETGIAIEPADLAFIDLVETRLAAQAPAGMALRCRVTQAGIAIEAGEEDADAEALADLASRFAGEQAAASSASAPIGAAPCSCTADFGVPEFQIDWDRERRTGVPEAVLCEPKTPAQIDAIIAASRRAAAAVDAAVRRRSSGAGPGNARVARLRSALGDRGPGRAASRCADSGIGIVAAGTSDLPVAREAARTLAFSGHRAEIIADVGVAGLWRLMERLDALRQCRVLIAVAGMEGALFSVLAGLVGAPVIAVPTSVGYGVADGGKAALHAALASCAPGLVVVNIDNGFGAAAAAIKMRFCRQIPGGYGSA